MKYKTFDRLKFKNGGAMEGESFGLLERRREMMKMILRFDDHPSSFILIIQKG